MSFAKITSAFENHIEELPIDIRTQFENIGFTPDGKEYLRITVLQGETSQVCLGRQGQDLSVGICQIDVFTPLGTGGTQAPDAVADHFYRVPLVQDDIIVQVIDISQGPKIKNTKYYQTPVTMTYRVNTDVRN